MEKTIHSYRDLGLTPTKDMYVKAIDGKYAVPGYNFNNMEQIQAIITACIETKSPVILQVSSGARQYANEVLLKYIAWGSMEVIKAAGAKIPVALHLDHGDTYELCVSCVESGFSSVMIDGSSHSFEDNIALTKKVVEYAHQHGVSVEGELGVLAGIEDDVQHEVSHYTKPEEVEEFVEKTGVDSLAISIGTSHGAYKFKLGPGEEVPPLRFDILEEVEKRLPGFPIVLHGASSVVPEYVDMINKYGGKLENACGVPEDQLRKAAESAVCKINIDSDGRLAMTAKIREVLATKPSEFDPRKYLGPAREELIKMYKHKNENVLGSAGKA
ncbi:MAG: class II fructose-bisphosphate aldolase [Candidatus Omnitrophota bacterium]